MYKTIDKTSFSSSNYLMHTFNMSVTYMQRIKKDTLKTLGEVYFTKYALSYIT